MNGCGKEEIALNAFKDLYQCMHSVDTDDESEEYFLNTKVRLNNSTATYGAKFDTVQVGFKSQ